MAVTTREPAVPARSEVPTPAATASAATASTSRDVAGQAPGRTPDRGGYVAVWLGIGAVALVVALEVWIRWFASGSQFRPAPINSADAYPDWRLVTLRVIEAISAVVFLWLGNRTVVSPIRRERRLGIDGLIFIGCFLGAITDGVLNMHQYLFAWNAHSINEGSWSGFLPFHSPGANPRYAEALVWGLPMYVYFCIGVALGGCSLVRWLRGRFPQISDAGAFLLVFIFAFAFDFVVENSIIRLTQAYAFAKTTHALTLWPGSTYQFPIYESVFVGGLGTIFTALRLSAMESPNGTSFVERGIWRFRPALRPFVSALAVFGFCVTMLMIVYHLPLNWFGVTGTSVAHLPSYLRP